MASPDLKGALGGRFPEGFHFGDVLGMQKTRAVADEACFEIEIGPEHLNRHGTVHGGVLMAMLDTPPGCGPYRIRTTRWRRRR